MSTTTRGVRVYRPRAKDIQPEAKAPPGPEEDGLFRVFSDVAR